VFVSGVCKWWCVFVMFVLCGFMWCVFLCGVNLWCLLCMWCVNVVCLCCVCDVCMCNLLYV